MTMSEQELKLNVPVDVQVHVEKAVKRAKFSEIQLRALYFDTPSRALARARISLRLRLEGHQWVQTLKMPGEHSLSRIEINQDRPDATLDLAIYAGTPVGDVLSSLTEPLQVCYETDVQRLLREIRSRSGAVELAFDRGWLRAGTLQLPISEVEFELKRGKLEAVFETGRIWQQRFGLILDFRSKAERGDQLAQLAQTLTALEAQDTRDTASVEQQAQNRAQQVADFWKPRSAASIGLATVIKERDAAQALAAVTSECLEHIVRNTAVLCEVDTAGVCRAATPEHVHQLRVGIRRLRSAWSFFDGLTELPTLEHRQKIKAYFSQLGGTRDEDVLKESLLPLLAVAGLPPLVLPTSTRQDSSAQNVASTDFQSWLLDTLAQCTIPSITSAALTTPPAATITASSTDFEFPRALHAARKPALKPLLVKKLKKWHQQIVRNGLIFQTLDIEQQHALRKKSKRLRYALQYCETLFPESKLSLYRKQLATVQDILGEMNDLYVAQPLFESLKTDQPQAWFACGWIQARLGTLTKEAAEAFKKFAETSPPWR
jgi:inorganic triphosphatase YgiF